MSKVKEIKVPAGWQHLNRVTYAGGAVTDTYVKDDLRVTINTFKGSTELLAAQMKNWGEVGYLHPIELPEEWNQTEQKPQQEKKSWFLKTVLILGGLIFLGLPQTAYIFDGSEPDYSLVTLAYEILTKDPIEEVDFSGNSQV